MKQLKIAYRYYGPHGINGFGGGEQRWVVNAVHFLSKEGHIVQPCHEGKDLGYDLFIDPGFEHGACLKVRASKHLHLRFCGPWTPDHSSIDCVNSGNCIASAPYWETQQNFDNYEPWIRDGHADKVTPVFFPVPYSDDLLPATAQVPGFQRNEILWATKDMFHPIFAKAYVEEPGSHGWKIVNAGLCILKSLIRLQERVDFQVNFLMSHHLREAPDFLGIPALVDQIKNKKFANITPWMQLIDIMARCKLNVPVGGLWGSTPEAIFAGTLPMQHPKNQFYAGYNILPEPIDLTEDNYYDALERHWFDEAAYNTAMEPLQVLFEHHRTEGLRRNFKETLETIGVQ
jgi:hypothetical protein